MKNKIVRILAGLFSVFMAAALVFGATGCQGETSTPSGAGGAVALTIVKDAQTVTYTIDALKALPTITGTAGQMSSTGNISGPFNYKGVALSELLKSVGGVTEKNAVRVSAKDGYAMTLSYRQLTEGNFTIINSETGKECTASQQPVVFVAYEEAGKPIDENIGPLRLGIMTADKQVTEGHWWVKWTQKIEVIAVQQPWTLKLEGVITENMDQATFESGSAIGCHGVKWTDDQNRAWEGIPLWYLVGRVDDTDTHKGDAFSDAAADAGYFVHIVSSDGEILELTSDEVKRNDTLIVAYKRDGNPLPENQWPLRLVGATLTKEKMIGKIFKIKIHSSSGANYATTAPGTTTPGATVLKVVAGTTTKEFTLDTIKQLQSSSGNGGTRNKSGVVSGPFACQGVSLSTLVKAVTGADLTANQSVKVTASDGYSKTLTYDQITNGVFTTYDKSGNTITPSFKPVVCLVYGIDGSPLDAATGPVELGILYTDSVVTEGSSWVKMITNVEIITTK